MVVVDSLNLSILSLNVRRPWVLSWMSIRICQSSGIESMNLYIRKAGLSMIDWCRLWAALMFYMPNHDETLF